MEEGDKVSDCVLQTQIGNSSEQLIVVISATVLWFRDHHYDIHQFCKSLLSQRILKGPNELMYLELFLLAYRVLYTFKRIVFALLKLELKVNCKIELVAIRVVTAEGLTEKAEILYNILRIMYNQSCFV